LRRGFAGEKFFSGSHDAVIRVYDTAGITLRAPEHERAGAKFKCKIHVEIINKRAAPVRLAAASNAIGYVFGLTSRRDFPQTQRR
jgi:hypothetical protein